MSGMSSSLRWLCGLDLKGCVMPLTIKEAAKRFGISEPAIKNHIVSGQLTVERKGRQVLLDEGELTALVQREHEIDENACHPVAPAWLESFRAQTFGFLADQIEILAKSMLELKLSQKENQSLHEAVVQHQQEISKKELEIAKLQRDLLSQQRIHEKEIQEHKVRFEEKWALMQQHTADQLARGREVHERMLEEERRSWSDRLVQEQERFAHKLAEIRSQEGFWARLMRMITWS
jgi:excisionase family DNA binding protein